MARAGYNDIKSTIDATGHELAKLIKSNQEKDKEKLLRPLPLEIDDMISHEQLEQRIQALHAEYDQKLTSINN